MYTIAIFDYNKLNFACVVYDIVFNMDIIIAPFKRRLFHLILIFLAAMLLHKILYHLRKIVDTVRVYYTLYKKF